MLNIQPFQGNLESEEIDSYSFQVVDGGQTNITVTTLNSDTNKNQSPRTPGRAEDR